jgi:hypothetical protein
VHSARARDRRFVPPVARAIAASDAAHTGSPGRVSRSPAAGEEELLARDVETRVRGAAARERERPHRIVPDADRVGDDIISEGFDGEVAELIDDSPGVRPASGHAHVARPESGRNGPSPWGALPAPWEPLPAALIQSRTTDARQSGSASASAASVTPSPAPAPLVGSAEPAPAVHRAERGGGSAGEEPAHAEAPETAAQGPDIDTLARQVYNVLKRRLAAESRRGA